MDRVRDAVTFEVSSVDFAEPLYLKSGKKTWVSLFMCHIQNSTH